jgi:hypothetical protein
MNLRIERLMNNRWDSELETLAFHVSMFEVQEEEKPKFQLIFLKDDEDQSVEVVEVEKIVFKELEKRLEQGESVFITRKQKKKLKPNLTARKESHTEVLYLSHV